MGTSVCARIKISFTPLENNSQSLCGHDFANEKIIGLPI